VRHKVWLNLEQLRLIDDNNNTLVLKRRIKELMKSNFKRIYIIQILIALMCLPFIMAQQDQCQIDQTINQLIGQKFKPSGGKSSVYVTHLTFMDADTKTIMAQTMTAELINKAVVDGMQLAKNANSDLEINHPGHKLANTDGNVNKLVNIFWDVNLTKGDKIQKIVSDMMAPNQVDAIVTGQYLEKKGDIINVRPFVVSKSKKSIVSKNHIFDKKQFLCEDPQNPSVKILCQSAHEKIRDSVKELLDTL